jgi:hypothetical protein
VRERKRERERVTEAARQRERDRERERREEDCHGGFVRKGTIHELQSVSLCFSNFFFFAVFFL